MADSVSGKNVVKVSADKPGPGKASPEDLLKQAVTGGGEKAADARRPWLRDLDLRLTAVAAVALLAGAALGVLAVPRDGTAEVAARIGADLSAARADAARLDGEIARLSKAVAGMREAVEAARTDGRGQAADLSKRLGRLEQGVEAKLSTVNETLARSDREAGARLASLTAQIEKRATTPVAAPVAAASPAADPVRTGSIGEKGKPETIKTEQDKPAALDGWALRDVYDGIAMLEDRKRRLVEVAPGDSVPGVGRVEAIERRGRGWVVVTKLGLITPQTW